MSEKLKTNEVEVTKAEEIVEEVVETEVVEENTEVDEAAEIEKLIAALMEKYSMTKEEIEVLINTALANVTAEHEEEVKNLKNAIAEIQKSLEITNEEITKSKENNIKKSTEMNKNFEMKNVIKSAVSENIEQIKGITSTNQVVKITKEADVNVTESNVVDTNGNPAVNQYSPIEAGVTAYPTPSYRMRDIVNVGSINGAFYRWTEAGAGEGSADWTAEGAVKSQRDQDWTLNELPVKKLTAYTKVSDELLEDIDWAAEEISSDLLRQIQIEEDNAILNGTGTGNEIKGMLAFATNFSAGTLAHTIVSANMYDVIRVAACAVSAMGFTPNVVILNPADACKLDLLKSDVGTYLKLADGGHIWNLAVIAAPQMAAGNFLVCDSTKDIFKVRKEVEVVAMKEANDFTKNMTTILAEERVVNAIKSNHTGAFVKGEFTTAIAALNVSTEE